MAGNEDSRAQEIRVLCVALLGALLSLKGDGTFPLSRSTPPSLVQLVTSLAGVAFFAVSLVLVRPSLVRAGRGAPPPTQERLAWAIGSAFAMGGSVLLALTARHYAGFGYQLRPGVLLILAALSMAALSFCRKKPFHFLVAAALCCLAAAAYCIVYFPLHPERSDMLPLIEAAIARVAQGLDPYVVYARVHELPLTYLPGLWLSYLPGWALGLDPRWTHHLSLVLAALVIYKAASGKTVAAYALGIFLLTPYLVYRHDLYGGVYWLTLALTLALLASGRFGMAGAAFGWSVATAQFSWVLAPVLLAGLLRLHGPRKTLLFAGVASVMAGAFLIPFAVASPLFLHSVMGYWGGKMNFSGYNLGYWLQPWIGLAGLRVLQVAVVTAFTALAARRATDLETLSFLLAGCLFFFVVLNPVVWVYFFPAVVILLLAGMGFDQLTEGAPRLSRIS